MNIKSINDIVDYVAIRELSATYNRHADAADGKKFAALFTEDGVFKVRGNVYAGREEIAAVCSATLHVVHITTDPLVEINGDEARQSSRIIVARTSDDKSEVTFVTTGTYFDELVRTPLGWRFRERRGELDLEYERVRPILGT